MKMAQVHENPGPRGNTKLLETNAYVLMCAETGRRLPTSCCSNKAPAYRTAMLPALNPRLCRPSRSSLPSEHDGAPRASARQCRALAAAVGAAALSIGAAGAQTLPDAGSLRQQLEQERRMVLPPKAAPQLAAPLPMTSLGGATVSLSAIRFAGNTLLSDAQLAPVVAGFLNRPLDFAQLQNAAIAVATAYRQAGWVVRAYLPQQDIDGGVLTIQVVEAVFGKVHQQGGATRVAPARIAAIVVAAQAPGAPVHGDALDRALLLIEDLPGISVSGTLSEGAGPAETDLVLALADGALVSGDASIDNTGSRPTGEARWSANLNLNSPLQRGDLASASLVHTEGSDYVRVAYLVPLGSAGWRVGASASYLKYRLVGAEFAQLDASGSSGAGGLEASFPVLRARLKNLYLGLNADQKRFDNRSAGTIATRYRTNSASVGLNGNLFDALWGGGANSASLTLVLGNVDLDGSPNQAADAATTRSAGAFHKLRFAAAREQVLSDSVALFAGVSGQSAGKNLDSSEKFYLGGAGGVRAYPGNEGGGSEGILLNLEARARLPANFRLTGFFDWGAVRVNKHNAIAGAAVPNRFDLKGGGVSLAWQAEAGYSLKATLARRIGANPNPTAAGKDQDGSLDNNRLWLQAALPF
jgi:hemolysin activation/secretion protein